jgi:serine protease
MRPNVRNVALLLVAGLLAGCAGGGTSVPTTPAASSSSSTDTMFSARDAESGLLMHVYPTRERLDLPGVRDALRLRTTNLTYHGGLVQGAPKVYVVFWGSSWTGSGDPAGVANRLLTFLGAVGGSGWLGTVAQYTQSDGTHVGNGGSIFGGSYIDTSSTPPAHPTTQQVANEAYRAAAHFGDSSVNANILVALPHGVAPSGFATSWCAWHTAYTAGNTTVAFTNLPYMPDAGASCGANSVSDALDGVTIVGGHEQAEAETDPQLNAWYASSGDEIGDKCAWLNLQANPAAGGFPTQPLWSNAAGACVQSS